MIKGCRYPGHGTVAVVTLCRGSDVIARFASRLGAVMAGRTAAGGDSAVIEDSGTPGIGGMAVIAEVIALDMIGRLAIGNLVIVTTVTGTDDRKVIDAGYRTP